MTRRWGIAELPETLTLKCDSLACGHAIDGVPRARMHTFVGYPCTECGADMLTANDLRDTEMVFRFAEWCNKWLGWLGYFFKKRGTVSVNPHRGDLNVKKEAE